MARGFVTAEEVAKKAGVSRSAVSRTFTPGGSVSKVVRRKVLKAAQELGYRVNRLAQGLNNDRSNLIGVVGANLSSPFISKQLDLLSIGLLRRGLQCLLLNAADARKDIAPLIELLSSSAPRQSSFSPVNRRLQSSTNVLPMACASSSSTSVSTAPIPIWC